MAKKRTLEFNFDSMFEMINALDDKKEEAVVKAIEVSSRFVQKDLDKFFEEHHQTGKADESLLENTQIYNFRGKIEKQLGFDKTKEHGKLAHYFNKGTPRMKATKFIDKAFKNERAISSMKYVLGEYWRNGGERFK